MIIDSTSHLRSSCSVDAASVSFDALVAANSIVQVTVEAKATEFEANESLGRVSLI